MSTFNIIALVLVVTAIFAVINDRYIKLHRTIGVMLIALVMSLLILFAKWVGIIHNDIMTEMISKVHFGETLIQGMLGALLFAGAINIKSEDLKPRLIPITVLAICGVLISTLVVGYLMYLTISIIDGVDIPLLYCLTFAALISPTDPIAVLAILRSIGVSKGLEMDVCGESLFNDGIGLVIFTFFFALAINADTMSAAEVGLFFVQNVGGAILLGAMSSYIVYLLMRSTTDYHIEILLSLALVFGSFQFAEWIGVSAAITVVITGLVFGHLVSNNMGVKSRESLYTFWEVIDEILNTVLFVMLGVVLLLLPTDINHMFLGLLAIAIVLFGRWLSVAIPVSILKKWYFFSPRSIRILTWGGLRGGLSVAMALSLPESIFRDYILIMTYAVVVFSIIIQGTTIKKLAGKSSEGKNRYRIAELNQLNK
ncbi:cation:proton antiporter [Psychrobacter lutiphocae]|uniref:cation:proton antiporter n=1 Tax=Psychrobacter lutiphocae TaxID=540500 RepID=UPI0003748B35|nr:sodium:proton antiporter [Psychrobacter lutiphocae]